ncbi:MAG: hypothetical protein L0Y58_11690 [Verrucomicrobia subdivision 3 bacterium]|nr:hypothetical protein [Limisphaerales bacterium]
MKYLFSIFVLAVTAFASSPAPLPPPDKLLASDTLAVFTITDYGKARADLDRWAMVKLWNDPAMRPFRDKFMTKLKDDLVVPLEREFGVKFADYKDLCQGQVTLAITRNGWEGKPEQSPAFVLLVDTREKSPLLKTNLAMLRHKWIDSGKQFKAEKIRDIEFSTFIFSSEDISKTTEKVLPAPKKNPDKTEPEEKKPPKKHEWLVGQSESLLIVGTSAKEIEKILIRQSGGTLPSLSEHGPFAANYASLFRDSTTWGWVDLKALVDLSLKAPRKGEDEATPQGAINPDKVVSALGLGSLQTLAVNLKDSNEGCLLTLAVSSPESTRKGITRIVSYEARDAGPPPFVPADAVKFTRWRIDLPKAWAALEATLVDMNPAYAGLIKLFVDNAGKDKDPEFDLRKNLVANLGDDLIIWEKKPKDTTLAAVDRPPTIYLLSSPRAEQMAGAIKSLTAFLPQPSKFKEREFLGRRVCTVDLPAAAGASGAGKTGPRMGERTLSYAASGSYVVFSTDQALLEEYLRAADARPLRETPGFAQAAEKVGGTGTGLFGFENQAENWRVMFEALKKESASIEDLISGSRLAGKLDTEEDKKFKEWFDFSLLPDFDQVAKYFYYTVFAGTVTTDAMTFKWFSPNPPGLK